MRSYIRTEGRFTILCKLANSLKHLKHHLYCDSIDGMRHVANSTGARLHCIPRFLKDVLRICVSVLYIYLFHFHLCLRFDGHAIHGMGSHAHAGSLEGTSL